VLINALLTYIYVVIQG